MQLSKNFTLKEFTHSKTARLKGIDNTPYAHHRRNMGLVAELLQEIRDALGRVRISSGYRCKELNKEIGGASSSDHLLGLAADFRVAGMTVEEVFQWIIENIDPEKYRIVIQEKSRWIHISVPDGKRRTGIKNRYHGSGKYTVDDKYEYKGEV